MYHSTTDKTSNFLKLTELINVTFTTLLQGVSLTQGCYDCEFFNLG